MVNRASRKNRKNTKSLDIDYKPIQRLFKLIKYNNILKGPTITELRFKHISDTKPYM